MKSILNKILISLLAFSLGMVSVPAQAHRGGSGGAILGVAAGLAVVTTVLAATARPAYPVYGTPVVAYPMTPAPPYPQPVYAAPIYPQPVYTQPVYPVDPRY